MTNYGRYGVLVTVCFAGDRDNSYSSEEIAVSAVSVEDAEQKVRRQLISEDGPVMFKTDDGDTLYIGEKLAENSAFIFSAREKDEDEENESDEDNEDSDEDDEDDNYP